MKNIIIVGAGGFGRELRNWFWDCFDPDEWRIAGFLGSTPADLSQYSIDEQIVGDPFEYQPAENERFLLAIGNIDDRRAIVDSIENKGGQFLSMIHPSAIVSANSKVGHGAIIYPFALVANSATLGNHVHLSNYASVGHDAKLGNYSLLSPYATLNGGAVADEEVFVGTHAMIGPGIHVGSMSKISANSAATRDVPPRKIVFGVPGKQAPQVLNT